MNFTEISKLIKGTIAIGGAIAIPYYYLKFWNQIVEVSDKTYYTVLSVDKTKDAEFFLDKKAEKRLQQEEDED